MQSKQDKEKEKPSYEKPRLRTIELAAEEVLGTGCKTMAAPMSGVGTSDCLSGSCVSSFGS